MTEEQDRLLTPLIAIQNAFHKFNKYWESFSHYLFNDEIDEIPNLEYKLMKMNILLNNAWLLREIFPEINNRAINTYIQHAENLVYKAESHYLNDRAKLIELRNEYDDYLKAIEGLDETISRTIKAINLDK